MVEEGVRELSPSSLEISFPAEHSQHTQSAPQTMQNRTTNYVETHHKTPANRTRDTIQKPKQRSERKQKNQTSTPKKFSALILYLLSLEITVTNLILGVGNSLQT
jgi:hypothetical protein